LLKKAGLDFESLKTKGIFPTEFAKELKSSGLVENQKLTWIAFNACYDFAYLLKILSSPD
jgi:CCR4-NOT transcription complex subunit 7/8